MRGGERQASLARERCVEEFDERGQERREALGRQRDKRALAHAAVDGRAVAKLRQPVVRTNAELAQRADDDRQERYVLAADVDAEIELKPIVCACLDLRIPIGGFDQFVRKRGVDLDAPAARAQRRHHAVEELHPALLPRSRKAQRRVAMFDELDLRPRHQVQPMAVERRAGCSFELIPARPAADAVCLHGSEFVRLVGREMDGVRAVRKRQLGDCGERGFREPAQSQHRHRIAFDRKHRPRPLARPTAFACVIRAAGAEVCKKAHVCGEPGAMRLVEFVGIASPVKMRR